MATSKKKGGSSSGGGRHVYKFNTGNLTPEYSPVVTKKMVSSSSLMSSWGLLKRSKTYRENYEHQLKKMGDDDDNNIHVAEEEKKGRKSVSSIVAQPARKSSYISEEGRKSVSSMSQVEVVNVGTVVHLLKVKVLVTDMPPFMQLHAFRCARQTYDSLDNFTPKHLAFNMKKEFDKVYGPAWHCIVGSSFGSFVTHSTGCFLYFSMEKLYILIFRTKVQKALD